MRHNKEIAGISHTRGHLAAAKKAMGGNAEIKKKFIQEHVSQLSAEELHHTLKYIAPGSESSPHMDKKELQQAITFALQGITTVPEQSVRDRAVKRWIATLNFNWRRADDFITDIMKLSEDSAIRRNEMLKIVEALHHITPEQKAKAFKMNKPEMMSILVSSWKKLYYHDAVVRLNNSERRVGHLRLLFGQGAVR